MTDTSETIQVLTFDLSGETFALPASFVQEVLDVTPEVNIPGAPPFISAVINFRGRVIPLADLRLAFGLERRATTLHSRIVVIEFEIDGDQTLIGLRADKVHEVTSIARDDREALPSVGTRWRPDFVETLARRDGDVVVIPALAAVFAARGGDVAIRAAA